MLLCWATSEVSQGPFNGTKNPRRRLEFVQKIVDSFWQRWSRDALPALVTRKAWHTDRRNVVVEMHPETDGRVRNVKVKTRAGDYTPPVTKIAVIYPAEGYD